MKQSRISVDFNELLEPDLVLLSKTDTRADSAGAIVVLHEGLSVHIYEEDVDANGRPDNLIADGVVEKNQSNIDWTRSAKWCCRIDRLGVRHESECEGDRNDGGEPE